ncbi:MAG: ExeM/NucH family extracellular endonuclease, partial [Thermoflexales bacterium]|nr:ExeM/NucH family extracellular endonuclease [Thermoflexales bacterium]
MNKRHLVLISRWFSTFVFALICAAVWALLSAKPAQAQSTPVTITRWTFENTLTPVIGTGVATYTGGTAAGSASGGCTATGFAAGFASSCAWQTTGYPSALTGTNKTAGVEFRISTTGFQSITLRYNHRFSNASANTAVVRYSVDGGATYNDIFTLTLPSLSGDTWHTPTVDFSSIPAVSNLNDFRVRIVSAYAPPTNTQFVAANAPNTTYSGGTWRFDNVTFSGHQEFTPTVAAVNPPNSASNVPLNASVTITFSEAVTVTGDWFTLNCSSSGLISATNSASVTVSGGPTTFVLTPTALFAPGETCTLTVFAAQVSDQDAVDPPDNMAANFTSSFTTAATTDQAPSVQAVTPPNNAQNVALTQTLVVTFSEPVTVTGDWFTLACANSGVRLLSSNNVTFTGGLTAFVISPTTAYSVGETCTLTVTASLVSDQDTDDPPDTMAADFTSTFTVDQVPSVSAVSPANGATNVALSSVVVVTFSEPVNVAGNWFTLACGTSGVRQPGSGAMVTGGPATFTISPTTPFALGESCTLTVTASLVTDQDAGDPPDNMAADFVSSFSTVAPPAICTQSLTPIGVRQGSGLSAPSTNISVTVRGVVIADFELTTGINGFYLQSLPTETDGDPATSDGIFVFSGSGNNFVSVGQIVVVTGTLQEFFQQTELGTITTTNVFTGCGVAPLPTPVDVTLPLSSVTDLEKYEGMLVRLPQNLTVTDNYFLGRFGQVTLSANGRQWQPTQVVSPGAPALALSNTNTLNRIILDDRTNAQNPDPVIFARGGLTLTAANTLRGGDTVSNVVGVLVETWGGAAASPTAYRVRALEPTIFITGNPRPLVTAPNVGGRLRVASANLLNYFNTFGSGACTNGVGGSSTDCRGADSAAEFARQVSKTIPALIGLNADVIGLMELENDGYGPTSAVQDLVNRLNAVSGTGVYTFVNPDATLGVNALGVDAIKVGIVYRPGRVTPVGQTAVLTTGAFGLFPLSPTGSIQRNRPPLAQAFRDNITGQTFVVVVNHFKSKGSSCADNANTSPAPNDVDTGDGQGNCNLTRKVAAQQLASWLATDPTGTGTPHVLILGDLNSYAKEDPIVALRNAGYIDLAADRIGFENYSYLFNGQWGTLDYALASPSLNPFVTGIAKWHINADEPSVLDYNTNFKSTAQQSYFFAPDPYRSSDHDFLVVGLDFNAKPQLSAIATYNTGLGGNGAEIIDVRNEFGALTNSGHTSFDRLDLSDILSPTLISRIGPSATLNGLNSLAIHPTKDLVLLVAGVPVSASNPVNGKVLAFRLSTGAFITEALVGIHPDAIAISPNGNYAVVANEAEAPGQNDNGGPGSISVIDLSGFDPNSPTPLNVVTLTLPSQASTPGFSQGRFDDIGRLPIDNSPSTLEPESVAFSADSQFAFVSLQENNGVVRVEMNPPYTLTFFGLYSTTHLADLTNGSGYNPVETLTAWREPDGVAVLDIGGQRYFITADEGDTRPTASSAGVRGGRTVSLFRADTGAFVADTAGGLDDLAARWGRYPDTRSNRGGSEPEVVHAVLFSGKAIAAVGLERADAVALLDITQPQTPTLFGLIPTGAAPEGVKLVARNQALYVLAANEVSGTVTIARVPVGQHIFTQQRATVNAFPLHDLVVLDPDFSDTFTVTLTLDPSKGGLGFTLGSGASGVFNVASGVYTITGSITGVNATLANAVFTPTIGISDTVLISVTATDGKDSDAGLVTLNVNASVQLTLTADPTTLPVGTLSTLTVTVTDLSNQPVNGATVSFATSLGTVNPSSATTVGGVATATLSSTVAGVATVTVTVGSVTATVQVTFLPGPVAVLSLTATPSVIFANGISQSVVVATATDAFGNLVSGATVQFLAGL